MKKYLFVLLMLIIGLVGCGESTVEKVDQNPKSAESSSEDKKDEAEAEAPTPTPAPQEVAGIGDKINFDGLHITLNEAFTSNGSDWEKPSNDHYLILDLTIENTTDKSASVSTLMQMSLIDEEGYSHNIAFFTDTKGSVDGELGPGRKVRGQVAFDVNTSSVYEFIFEDVFTSGQAIWEVKVD